MNKARPALIMAILAGVIIAPLSASELRHNPFLVPLDVSGSSSNAAAALPAGNGRPTLIGILLGDDQPLVNLDGTIIGVGEESAGYLLVEVAAEYAVFRRGEETITMPLDPSDNDE